MTAVEEIREAARLMREQAAEAGRNTRWHVLAKFVGPDKRHMDYVASWHPGVALAVADWLDVVADEIERLNADGYGILTAPALQVARAYLGGAS